MALDLVKEPLGLGSDGKPSAIRRTSGALLPEAVLKDMMRRNRNVSVHTVENCGHAPALIGADQIEVVTRFLNEPDAR